MTCLAIESDITRDSRHDNSRGAITGIAFQRVDTGRVNPVLPDHLFTRVDWANSRVGQGQRSREYIGLDDPDLAVPDPIPAAWEDFANTMSQTRDALLRKVSLGV